jgi:hypothetical protein
MAGTQYLLDSNILLRWVKPDHNDYPLVVSAADAIIDVGGPAPVGLRRTLFLRISSSSRMRSQSVRSA